MTLAEIARSLEASSLDSRLIRVKYALIELLHLDKVIANSSLHKRNLELNPLGS